MKKILIVFYLISCLFIVQVFSAINWSNLPNLSEKKRGASSETINDKVYVVGGFNISNGFRPTLEYYDLNTSTEWEVITNLPTPRAYLSSVLHDTAIIAIGGGNDPGSPAAALITVELYDFAGGDWESFPDMNTPRAYHCSEIVGDTIYVFGGGNSSQAFLNSIEKITIGEGSWTTISTTLPSGWKQMASCVWNDKIYIMGGQNSGATGNILEFDPSDESITVLTAANYPRFLGEAVSTPYRIFFVGGDNAGPLNNIEMYKTSIDEWSNETNLPGNLSDFAICYSSGTGMILCGGFNGINILETVIVGEIVQDPLKVNSISGVVKNAYTKLPEESVSVSIIAQTLNSTTDENGEFSFSNLNYGTIDILCEKTGYLPNTYTFSAEPDADYNIEIEITNTSDLVNQIRGDVRDKVSGMFLSGVQLTLNPESLITTSTFHEGFEFDCDVNNISWGNKTIIAKKQGYKVSRVRFLAEPAGNYNLQIEMVPLEMEKPIFYPNPYKPNERGSDNFLKIRFDKEIKEYTIYDIEGNEIYKWNRNWIGVEEWKNMKSGVYIIKVTDVNDQVYHCKFAVIR